MPCSASWPPPPPLFTSAGTLAMWELVEPEPDCDVDAGGGAAGALVYRFVVERQYWPRLAAPHLSRPGAPVTLSASIVLGDTVIEAEGGKKKVRRAAPRGLLRFASKQAPFANIDAKLTGHGRRRWDPEPAHAVELSFRADGFADSFVGVNVSTQGYGAGARLQLSLVYSDTGEPVLPAAGPLLVASSTRLATKPSAAGPRSHVQLPLQAMPPGAPGHPCPSPSPTRTSPPSSSSEEGTAGLRAHPMIRLPVPDAAAGSNSTAAAGAQAQAPAPVRGSSRRGRGPEIEGPGSAAAAAHLELDSITDPLAILTLGAKTVEQSQLQDSSPGSENAGYRWPDPLAVQALESLFSKAKLLSGSFSLKCESEGPPPPQRRRRPSSLMEASEELLRRIDGAPPLLAAPAAGPSCTAAAASSGRYATPAAPAPTAARAPAPDAGPSCRSAESLSQDVDVDAQAEPTADREERLRDFVFESSEGRAQWEALFERVLERLERSEGGAGGVSAFEFQEALASGPALDSRFVRTSAGRRRLRVAFFLLRAASGSVAPERAAAAHLIDSASRGIQFAVRSAPGEVAEACRRGWEVLALLVPDFFKVVEDLMLAPSARVVEVRMPPARHDPSPLAIARPAAARP
eukprot:tig00020830_g14428.t1